MKRGAFMSMSVLRTYVELSVLDFIVCNVLQGCGSSLSQTSVLPPEPPFHHLTFQRLSANSRQKNGSWFKKV